MHFTAVLLVCASFVATSIAQGKPTFTRLPGASVRAGSSVSLEWSGTGDDESVSIYLKQGTEDDLINAPGSAGLITGDGRDGAFTWDVPDDLPNRPDYALQIQRNIGAPGVDDTNYSGLFAVTGGSSSSSASSSAASSASSSARSVLAGAGSSRSASSASSSIAPSSANATTTSASARATILPTGAVGTGASGTGMSMSRNTTMSRPTLSASSSSSSETASSTSGMGEASATEGETAPSSSPTGAAVSLASNFALLFAAIMGVVYLG